VTWNLPLGTTIVHLPFWPSALALTGVLVAVAAAALIRQTMLGSADALGQLGAKSARGWLVLVPLVLLLGAPPVHFRGLLSGPADSPAILFRGQVLVGLAFATLGVAVLVRALAWRAALPPEARVKARRFAQAAWAGALIAQVALLHAGALLTLGERIPILALPEPAFVHVGRSANITPRLVGVGAERRKLGRFHGWVPAPLVVTGDLAGTKEITLRAQHRTLPWLTMTARVPIRIVEERGDASFPLRVGNRWRYEVTSSSGVGGLIGFLGAEGSRAAHELQIRVEATDEILGGGVRAFRLALEGTTRVEVQVYAVDGELFFIDEEGSHLPLLPARPGPEMIEDQAANLGFGLFRGAVCTCGLVGPLRGPAVCRAEIAMNAGIRIGVGILTFGLVAPGDETIMWKLLETTAGPAEAPALVSSAVIAACQAPPRIDIEPGDDKPPEVRSTFQQSLAARPEWANDDEGALPQLAWRELTRAFEERGAVRLPARDVEELVCKVTYRGNPDSWFSVEPDLNVTLKVGEIGPIALHNADDVHDAMLSVGPLTLRGDERISAHLIDRNSFGSNEDLGVVAGSLRGELPLRARRGLGSIECGGLPRAEVEAILARSLADADEQLTALAGSRLSPIKGDEDFGLAAKFAPARDKIESAAALVGWADPRVARRLAWERRLGERFADKAASLVRDLSQLGIDEMVYDSAPPVALRVMGLSCGADVQKAYAKADQAWGRGALRRWGCVLRVSIENRGESTHFMHLSWAPLSPSEPMMLALGSGKSMKLQPIEVEGAEHGDGVDEVRRLRAGARGVVILVPLGPIPAAKEKALNPVVLLVGRTPTVLSFPTAP
jgi:hypothetical protein